MKLIDLESPEVDAILDKYKYKDGGKEYNRGVNDLLFQIQHAPTIDPIKHGKWVKSASGDGEDYCSACKTEPPWFHPYGYYEPSYCPHCGAKMDL